MWEKHVKAIKWNHWKQSSRRNCSLFISFGLRGWGAKRSRSCLHSWSLSTKVVQMLDDNERCIHMMCTGSAYVYYVIPSPCIVQSGQAHLAWWRPSRKWDITKTGWRQKMAFKIFNVPNPNCSKHMCVLLFWTQWLHNKPAHCSGQISTTSTKTAGDEMEVEYW